MPVASAVHAYHTEAPPGLPAWSGSPGSFVAPMLFTSSEPLLPKSPLRLRKKSSAGGPLGKSASTSTASALVTASAPLPTTTLYAPALAACTFVRIRQELVAPGRFTPFLRHWKTNGTEP